MPIGRRYATGLALVALSAVVSAIAYPEMPATMATHWNAGGEADGTTPKTVALAAIPALSAALLVLFSMLPKIDPLGENVAAFREEYDTFVVLVVALLSYLHVLVVGWNAGYRFEMIQALAPALGVLFYYAGVLTERAERNWFVGIKTPWTLSSDEVWKRTHERVAPLLKLAGLVAALVVFVPAYAELLIAVPAAAVAAYAFVYSYLEHRQVAA